MSTSPSSRPPDHVPARHGGLVRLAVVLTILLVVGMMSSICLRWMKVREPTTAILIHGDPSLDGAVVVVESIDGSANSDPVTVKLGESNRYQTPIFRFPGQYRVTVTLPWMTQPLLEAPVVSLDRFRGTLIELPTLLTITGDDSLAGTVVAVGGQGRRELTGTLNKANDFRITIPVLPGQYSILATRNGATITAQDVTVLPHIAKPIDLRKKS